jgi:hypothetical protein
MAAGQRLVAYERVSTARQGASGLGLEAQRKVIEDFAVARGAEVLARFTEVESGRKGVLLHAHYCPAANSVNGPFDNKPKRLSLPKLVS